MCSRSSRPEDGREDEAAGENAKGSSTLLKLGTLAVIGAMAANVFGFRYSRWAVGKEIHRGWETHARNVARQAARARANARRSEYARAKETERRAEERAREHARRAQREKQERDSTKRAYQRWEESFDNSGRRNTGRRYQRWEETFDNGYRVHIEFDSRFEDMFKGPFGMPEEVLREFLRSAQRQTRGRVEDFDAFRFWEEVHGAGWGSGGMGGGGGMGGSGTSRGERSGFSRNLARHYAALGLKEGASAGEVKSAYRREAMKWHPDRYRGNDREGAARKFREVTEAYDALK